MTSMASCFSSSSIFATAPVVVISQIPKLYECLKACALPGILIKSVNISAGTVGENHADAEQMDLLSNAEIAVCDPLLLLQEYKNMPKLKWAHCTWAGVDPLIKAMPKKPSFILTRHAGEEFCSLMAEYVMCHVLSFERQCKLNWKNQEQKKWGDSDTLLSYRSLDNLTIALLGVGNMASAIARFFKTRGTKILGFARQPRTGSDYSLFDKISTNLDDILPECDYICNTLPHTPLTAGMVDISVFKKCQKKPVFINVGRGSIVSENDLVNALRTGLLSGAVLDVFTTEPLPESSELWTMPQVTLTPHISALSKPEHVADEFFKNFSCYIDGHGLQNVVNWSCGY